MKLIDLLVQELPKLGGWPDNVDKFIQQGDGEVMGFSLYANFIRDNNCWLHSKHTPPTKSFPLELSDDVSTAIVARYQYEAALAASHKVEWDGNGGLPPVGCECEYETKGYGVKKVKVECITNDGIAFTWLGNDPEFSGLDCINIAQIHRFRPLRSEADKKRETAVEAMNALWNLNSKMHCEAIYDAIKSGQIVIE